MANCCYFTMKIAGKPEQVNQFANQLNTGFGRVYSFETDLLTIEKDSCPRSDLISVIGQGDCAWSISTAMPNLLEVSERLGLCIEVFSSEPGNGFQEHYIYDKGSLLVDECVDYCEYWVSGYGEEEIQELLEELEITREELFSKLNEDEDYCIGGFEDFGDFQDLFLYWTPEILKEHNTPVQDPPEKLKLWARVGVSLEVTPETYQKLLGGNSNALLDVLHGKGGEAYLDSETYFPDIPENFDLVERSYDLGREPLFLGQNKLGEKTVAPIQDKPCLDDIIREATEAVKNRPSPTPEPEKDH